MGVCVCRQLKRSAPNDLVAREIEQVASQMK